ncbi:ankyrin [Penicillium malachiteum]|nr:ankyrin [Penicillium malachiteum]
MSQALTFSKSNSRSGYSTRIGQMTALHLAAYFGIKEVALKILQSQRRYDRGDGDGRSPLSWAVENGYRTIVEPLLEKGAGLTLRDNCGRTPLTGATGSGHENVIKLLLENRTKLAKTLSFIRQILISSTIKVIFLILSHVSALGLSGLIQTTANLRIQPYRRSNYTKARLERSIKSARFTGQCWRNAAALINHQSEFSASPCWFRESPGSHRLPLPPIDLTACSYRPSPPPVPTACPYRLSLPPVPSACYYPPDLTALSYRPSLPPVPSACYYPPDLTALSYRPSPPPVPTACPYHLSLPPATTRLILPLSPTALSYRSLLPFSPTVLSYRSLLPLSPTALSYRLCSYRLFFTACYYCPLATGS